MQIRTNLRSLYRDDLPPEVASGLGEIYPAGWDELGRFTCELLWTDPRVGRIIAFLASNGYQPSAVDRRKPLAERVPYKQTYWLMLDVSFTLRDLEQAAYLQLSPYRSFAAVNQSWERSPTGLIQLHSSAIKPRAKIAQVLLNQVVVAEEVRERLESAGLHQVVFRDVELIGSRRSAPRYFEMTSEVILPPMADRCKFLDGCTGEEVPGDHPRPFVLRKGLEFPDILMRPPQFHYTAAAIEAIEPFDLGRTRETFGYEDYRQIIVSNRLYQVLAAAKLTRVAWIPVEIG